MAETKLYIDDEGLDERGAGEALITEIKNHLKLHYEPAADLASCDLHLTTAAIFNRLQALYPAMFYGPNDVAEWLKMLGYKWVDIGNMRFEWVLKRQGV